MHDTTTAHLKKVLATVDVERIRKANFHVLLDANHGSGSVLGRRLLNELGCTVTTLGGTPDVKLDDIPKTAGAAAAGGATTLGGLMMLIHQGAEAFRLWLKQDPPIDVMVKAARQALALLLHLVEDEPRFLAQALGGHVAQPHNMIAIIAAPFRSFAAAGDDQRSARLLHGRDGGELGVSSGRRIACGRRAYGRRPFS